MPKMNLKDAKAALAVAKRHTADAKRQVSATQKEFLSHDTKETSALYRNAAGAHVKAVRRQSVLHIRVDSLLNA